MGHQIAKNHNDSKDGFILSYFYFKLVFEFERFSNECIFLISRSSQHIPEQ